MKKITADFHKQMETTMPKTKTILVEAANEEYEIVLKNSLSIEEKAKLLQEVISIVVSEEDVTEEGGATLLLMLIYKSLTDIEFPEKLVDQVSQFTWLLDTGILKKVSDNLREGIVEDLSNFLSISLIEAQKLIEEKNPR